jgi:hypothetical protein
VLMLISKGGSGRLQLPYPTIIHSSTPFAPERRLFVPVYIIHYYMRLDLSVACPARITSKKGVFFPSSSVPCPCPCVILRPIACLLRLRAQSGEANGPVSLLGFFNPRPILPCVVQLFLLSEAGFRLFMTYVLRGLRTCVDGLPRLL